MNLPARRLPVRWESVVEERPLLDVLANDAMGSGAGADGAVADDERFVFVEGDGAHSDGIVGWGVAARIRVGTGPARFERARAALATLAESSSSRGPIAFTSLTFDEDDDASVMVVPQVCVLRRRGVTWRITAGEPEPAVPGARTGSATVAEAGGTQAGGTQTGGAEASGADRPRYAGSTVRDDRWLEAVAAALTAIDAGAYAKVVLARDLHLWSKQPFDIPRLLRDLAARFPSCMTFLVDHLVGASPELLLRRNGDTIASRVLAGTAPRGADLAEDAALGAALLASDKDLREHDLALRSAVEVLAPICSTLGVPEGPNLVRLENVQHLGSDLTGTLRSGTEDGQGDDAHMLSLLARLHPTAAVGGAPRAEAVAAIRELEGMSRGRYAGPVGWCTSDGDGEFAIALRCAEVRGDRARLFAGAGIVAGSLPESELTETWLKLRAMTGVLGAGDAAPPTAA